MNFQFIIIAIGYTISAAITLGLAVFVLFSNAEKTIRVTFFLWSFAVFVYELMFLFATNTDLEFAKKLGLIGLVIIYVVAFMIHWIFAVLGRVHEKKKEIFFFYATGTLLVLFFLVFPETFIGGAKQKMYFSSYLVPGKFYWVMLTYFFAGVAYFYYHLIRAYFKTKDQRIKNRFLFYIWGLGIGYFCGSTAFFLVWDIPIDPILSMFVGFYTIPLAYGIVKYNLMDIRVIIRYTLIYSIIIAAMSGFIMSISLLNTWFIDHVPGIQPWFIPIFAGITAVFIGRLFWNKSHEADLLKYEFVTIMAHRLRTPLTRIKWMVEALLPKTQGDNEQKFLHEVSGSTNELIELVDVMLKTSKEDEKHYSYTFAPTDVVKIAHELLVDLANQFQKKNLSSSFSADPDTPLVLADTRRLAAAIRIILENTLLYTDPGDTITVRITPKKESVVVSVTDTGIGISHDDIPYIFEKFFRTHKATLAYTEGVGLGLFMVKRIILKHGGEIGITSPGEGKGTTVWFTLPIVRKS